MNFEKTKRIKDALLRRYQIFIPMVLVSSLMLVGYAALDKEAPVIKTDVLTIEHGDKFDIGMIQIEDNQTSLNELNIEYDISTLDTRRVGNSNITVQATDLSNNVSSKIIEVRVVDTKAPVYYLVSNEQAFMEDGVLVINLNSSNSISDYIMAKDNADGDLTPFINVTGALDTSVVSKQALTLSVEDNSKNVNTKTFDVEVRDIEAPTIEYVYGDQIEIDYGSEFKLERYVKISDNSKGKLAITTSKNVDTKLPEQTVEIVVTDESGNTSKKSLTIFTKDVSAPVINVGSRYEILEKTPFDIHKYLSVVDLKDGDLTSKAEISGTVNPNVAGTYSIKITAKDAAGNTAEKWVTVIVRSQKTAIVNTAYSKVGCPYVYGGTGPNGFDCSGFVQWVYRQNGISIPRTTYSQYAAGTKISYSQIQPGDLIFFNTNGQNLGHVGLYVGGGKMIHAGTVKTGVCVAPVSSLMYCYAGTVRF